MRVFGKQIAPADLALALAGALGLVCFFLLLPAQHPDSSADYSLDEENVEQAARAFVKKQGIPISEEAQRQVRLQRNGDLLDALQHAVGRPEVVRLLKTEAGERLPAYHWEVEWQEERDEAEDYQVGVYLTAGGDVYSLSVSGVASESTADRINRINRKGLSYALSAGEPPADVPVAGVPDSLLARYLSFDFARKDSSRRDTAREEEIIRTLQQEAGEQGRDARVFRIPPLGREEAVRLARYHLRQTALRGWSFRLDTVQVEQHEGSDVAEVRFWSDAFHGQRLRADVEVTAAGALRDLEAAFNPDEGMPADLAERASGSAASGSAASGSAAYRPPEEEAGGEAGAEETEGDVVVGIEGDTVASIVTGMLFVVLALASLVVFFRRISARVVDTSSALRDAIWGGLFAAVALALPTATSLVNEGPEEFWQALLGTSLVVILAGAGGAFLIFLASGAMDSVARARWSEKLATLDLVRRGALRNVPVGAALLRGLAAAAVILGGTTFLLVGLPEATLHLGDDFLHNEMISIFAFSFAMSSWVGLFISLTVLLGVGTLLYRWRSSAWVVVPGIALVLTLLQVHVTALYPIPFLVAGSGLAALILAGVFWRYDFVTAFTAYLFACVLWMTAAGWMIEGSPAAVDAVLALVTFGGVGLMGLVGLVSGQTSTEVPEYVPSYIEELAEQERLQRDIEIAQEVQQSFLPRRMPQVEGLDLAAMCLPAREVGGDYYDFIDLGEERLAVTIGDVSGKGIQASFFMTLAKGYLQSLAAPDRSPAEVLRRVNALFGDNAPPGTFISMIYGIVDPRAGTFTFARAGHTPLLRFQRAAGETPERDGEAGTTHFMQPGGMAVGLASDQRFRVSIEEVTLSLHEGDLLVFYTDGFSEAMNTRGEQFGEARLAERIRRHSSASARYLLQAVADDVHAFVEAAGRHDDMTMIVIKRGRSSKKGGSSEKGRESGERSLATTET